MGLDQKRKQHNKDVRGDGSVLGLAEDEEKLQHWMIWGPDMTRADAEV